MVMVVMMMLMVWTRVVGPPPPFWIITGQLLRKSLHIISLGKNLGGVGLTLAIGFAIMMRNGDYLIYGFNVL